MTKRIIALAASFLIMGAASLFAQETAGYEAEAQAAETQTVEQTEQAPAQSDSGLTGAIKYIAAAIAVGFACIGGAMAVGKIGAAAMGAMSENAELSGKALPFVGLAEGICLWGFLVALFIIIM
ncbi:ATP synthase subunit C [Treponema sp.]|jgi:V/A-type H+-transporting ATPase subunit K|uniref:ATP synthase subunit C n=1 Tax=Treponema sp. TaxID=166 RepID=UPI001B1C91F1|nr:ATP synthase subunit C [Treponema sp.]MBE6353434.1 ATPase [Treponema sp.]MBO6176900.1 ATPase [Treponema sp.]